MNRNYPSSAVPTWVVQALLVIGFGWAMLLCVASGLLSTPTVVTKPARPTSTTTPSGEK